MENTPNAIVRTAWSFGKLLRWHLNNGTRPDNKNSGPGKRWAPKEFAAALGGLTDRAVRNWLNEKNLPTDIANIERALFGTNEVHRDWLIELRRAFDVSVSGPCDIGPDNLWTDCPYPGLLPFTPEQGAIFFGRTRETETLASRVRDPSTPFLAIVGDSGIGKSSLVRAGLIAGLNGKKFNSNNEWNILTFSPGFISKDPFAALAVELCKKLPHGYVDKPASIAETLAADPTQLSKFADAILGGYAGGTALLLFIDQLEELFTDATSARQAAFCNLLAYAVADGRIRVATTLRVDFWPQCMASDAMAMLMQAPGALFPLGPPGPSALLEMIRGPAATAGIDLQDGLADQILTDAGAEPGTALPLVAFCLNELYHSTPKGKPLTLEAYRDLGNLRGAIKRRASKLLTEIAEREKADVGPVISTLFEALVNVDAAGKPSRRWVPRANLREELSISDSLLETLINGRLLLAGESTTLAHEALFQEWPDLKSWLKANSTLIQRVQRLLLGIKASESQDREFAAAEIAQICRYESKVGAPNPTSRSKLPMGSLALRMIAEEAPSLILALSGAGSKTRDDILSSLKLIGAPISPALVESALRADSRYIRKLASQALRQIGQGCIEATTLIAASLASESAFERENAAVALGEIGTASNAAVQGLTNVIAGSDLGLSKIALEALTKIGLIEAVPGLLLAAKSANSELRVLALEAILRLTSEASESFTSSGMAAVLVRALEDPDEKIRLLAAKCLTQVRPAARASVTELIDALNDSCMDVRRFAAYALEGCGSDPATFVPALAKFLNDPNEDFRAFIAARLASICRSVTTVMPALLRRGATLQYRDNLTLALTEFGHAARVLDANLARSILPNNPELLLELIASFGRACAASISAILDISGAAEHTPDIDRQLQIEWMTKNIIMIEQSSSAISLLLASTEGMTFAPGSLTNIQELERELNAVTAESLIDLKLFDHEWGERVASSVSLLRDTCRTLKVIQSNALKKISMPPVDVQRQSNWEIIVT